MSQRQLMKIGDFGISNITTDERPTTVKGTEDYMPKYYIDMKVIQDKKDHHFKNLDIYGFGLTFLEALLGRKIADSTHNVFNKDIQLESEYLEFFKRMIIETDNFHITMGEIHSIINVFLHKEVDNLKTNALVCYLCGEPAISEFFTLTGNCNNHFIHFFCYKDFLDARDDYPTCCPLCDTAIDEDEYNIIRDFLR